MLEYSFERSFHGVTDGIKIKLITLKGLNKKFWNITKVRMSFRFKPFDSKLSYYDDFQY